MQKYPNGTLVYIIQSKRFIREATVIRYGSGFYTIRFTDSSGGTRLREDRLFPSEEDAKGQISREEEKRINRYKDWMRK